MAKYEYHYNDDAFFNVRRTPEVQRKLEEIAEKIAAEANRQAGLEDGYRTSSQQGQRSPQGRWRTTVITADLESVIDNSRNNTLLRSIDAGKE